MCFVYNVLRGGTMEIQIVKPFDDEIEAIRQAETDIKNGDVFPLSDISWRGVNNSRVDK